MAGILSLRRNFIIATNLEFFWRSTTIFPNKDIMNNTRNHRFVKTFYLQREDITPRTSKGFADIIANILGHGYLVHDVESLPKQNVEDQRIHDLVHPSLHFGFGGVEFIAVEPVT